MALALTNLGVCVNTYSYYPLGACTCAKMGLGYEKPNSIGVVGYPIVEEGSSYLGFVALIAISDSVLPRHVAPSRSSFPHPLYHRFLPPACTAGTGAGNPAGLCNFSCIRGFCPMNACACSGQGAVDLTNPTTDVADEAAPGQVRAIYGPLCEYTCQRGYCPEGACVSHVGSSTGSESGSGSGDGDVYIAPSIWSDPSPVIQC